MVEASDRQPAGQNPMDMGDLDRFPPTVKDTEEQPDGVTLITIDGDPDRNIEVYDDERESHFSGNPPEE